MISPVACKRCEGRDLYSLTVFSASDLAHSSRLTDVSIGKKERLQEGNLKPGKERKLGLLLGNYNSQYASDPTQPCPAPVALACLESACWTRRPLGLVVPAAVWGVGPAWRRAGAGGGRGPSPVTSCRAAGAERLFSVCAGCRRVCVRSPFF